jgi:hypothetical protein
MLLWSANLGATGVAIATAALTLTGYAPTPVTPVAVAPAKGSIATQGYAPNVYVPEGMPFGPMLLFGLNLQQIPNSPNKGSLVATGYVPVVAAGGIESYGEDELDSQRATMSGTGIRILPGSPTRFPAKYSAAFTGYIPTFKYNAVMEPGAGSLVSAGYSSIPTTPLQMSAGSGTFTGYAPNKLFFEDQQIEVDSVLCNITGYEPGVTTFIDVPSGALVSAADFFTLHEVSPQSSGLGAFTGYAPIVAGEGFNWEASGTLNSRRASLTGTGVSTCHGSGTLTSRVATTTATAVNVVYGLGILDGGYATINASGHKGNGTLDSLPATMIGVGAVIEGAQSLDDITLVIRSKGITTTIKAKSISMQVVATDIDGQN